MERLLEFAVDHIVLVSMFFALWILFFVTESRRGGRALDPQEVTHKMNRENALVVDVRSESEFREGHIPGSINIPYAQLQERISELRDAGERPVVLVCALGNHSSAAGKMLRQQGFQDLWRLRRGLESWKAETLPVARS